MLRTAAAMRIAVAVIVVAATANAYGDSYSYPTPYPTASYEYSSNYYSYASPERQACCQSKYGSPSSSQYNTNYRCNDCVSGRRRCGLELWQIGRLFAAASLIMALIFNWLYTVLLGGA